MKISIYAIVGIDDDEQEFLYIGSTTNLNRRNREHKSKCNNPNNKAYNKPLYKHIRENGGWNNFIMEELINKEVNTKQEVLELERGYIELMGATLNKYQPGKYLELGQKEYKKEYRKANKEKMKQQMKKYYETNREKVKQQIKTINYQKVLCPYCNIEFMKGNKTNHLSSKKHQQNHINSLN